MTEDLGDSAESQSGKLLGMRSLSVTRDPTPYCTAPVLAPECLGGWGSACTCVHRSVSVYMSVKAKVTADAVD